MVGMVAESPGRQWVQWCPRATPFRDGVLDADLSRGGGASTFFRRRGRWGREASATAHPRTAQKGGGPGSLTSAGPG